MKLVTLGRTGVVCALLSLASPVRSQSIDAAQAETSRRWFVELASPPAVEGTSLATLRKEKDDFRAAARAAGITFRERFAFDSLFNGLSIEVDPSLTGALRRVAGVSAVYPVVSHSLPPASSQPAPELITALSMTGADVAQTSLGLTGAGIKVGIIDTGVDVDHPDLGGPGFPSARIIAGYDFVGNAYNSSGTTAAELTPVPDPNPDDCGGHGTHVAGIVGANGAIKGVAPGVKFGAYKVFGCTGTTDSDIMIAAMELALADGMHVVNMSIGSSYQWPQYPTAAAGTRLVNAGVVVVASIGNSGANGLYAASAPGVGSKVIGVASYDNTHLHLPAFTVSPDNLAIVYSSATGAPPAPLSGTYPMARTGTATTINDACNAVAPAPGSLTGKIALIRRGTCTFYEKSRNAQAAGAVGVVIYNNAAGLPSITVAGTPPITIPVVSITAASGVLIDSRLSSGPVDLTWTTQVTSTPNATGGLLASTSSYGLPPDLTLKPDIGAPGGFIRSTYPIELGSYANLSGTSMSSPHVAGAAALLLQARPNTPSQAVGRILQNSADPALFSGNPGLGFLDVVQRQGAGMVQIDKSVLATTLIEPGKLSLGESQPGPSVQTITILNKGTAAATYDIGHVAALATGPNTFTVAFFNAPATVVASPPSVSVPAGGSAQVTLTITPAAGLADRSLYGGYIVVAKQGGEDYRVPYAGFKGDYQSIPALTPTANGFPWLAKLVGTSYVNQPAGATFTLASGDIPYLILHLDHQVRRLRAEVFSAGSGRAWQRAWEEEYMPRNSVATSFFAFPWDGKTSNGNRTQNVPDGQYVIRLSALKALGDQTNPAHWETWTSPVITIDRP